MKNKIYSLGIMLSIALLILGTQDSVAQRRYKNRKLARTEEGIVVLPKKERKAKMESPTVKEAVEQKTETVEMDLVEETPTENERTDEINAEVKTEKNDKTSFVKTAKTIKVKDLYKEDKLAVIASSLVSSSKPLSKSKLATMLSPEKTSEMKPGMLFIIIGSVMAGVAITLWIIGSVIFLTSYYNYLLYVLFVVLGVLLWFGGLAMIAVGIVKLIRYNRGK